MKPIEMDGRVKKKKEKIRQSYTISTAELYKGHLLFCQESFKKKKG